MDYGKLYDDRIADTYDEDALGLLTGVRNLAMAQLNGSALPGDATILDLGAGTGLTLTALAPRFPQARCIGIDLSARMLEIAQRKLKLEAHVDDACNAGRHVPAGTVDLALAHFLTTFVSRPRLFQAAHGTLKPGGLFSVVSTTRGAFGRVRSKLDGLMGKGGFADEVSPAPESGEHLAAELQAAGFEIVAVDTFRKPIVFHSFEEGLDWGVKSGFFAHVVEKLGSFQIKVLATLTRSLFPFHDEYIGVAVLARVRRS